MSSHGRTLFILYVDGMIITRDDSQYIAFTKENLIEQFLMSDLGYLRYFLRIKASSTLEGSLVTALLRLPWSLMFVFVPRMVAWSTLALLTLIFHIMCIF
jgi:hypothetical protein